MCECRRRLAQRVIRALIISSGAMIRSARCTIACQPGSLIGRAPRARARHRVDRAHKNDIPHVARIDAGRELLRSRKDGRNGLLVVLNLPEMLLAKLAIMRRNTHAVIRLRALLHLIDKIADGKRMILGRAEHNRLLRLVDRIHEELHSVLFVFRDLDDAAEITFNVPFPLLDLSFDYLIIGCYRRTQRASRRSARL